MFYIVYMLMAGPWLPLLVGGVRRMRRTRHPYGRLQCWGAVILVLMQVGHLAIFAPHFGLDPMAHSAWAAWYPHAEFGATGIGLLFFGLGFFLERRPRPGLRPWPRVQRRIAGWSVFLGVALSVLCFAMEWGLDFAGPSLGLHRLVLSVGFFPFAFAYEEWSRRDDSPPPRTLSIGL